MHDDSAGIRPNEARRWRDVVSMAGGSLQFCNDRGKKISAKPSGPLSLRWKRDHDRDPATRFAVDLCRTTVKIDNRFYERESETRAVRAARSVGAIKPVEN